MWEIGNQNHRALLSSVVRCGGASLALYRLPHGGGPSAAAFMAVVAAIQSLGGGWAVRAVGPGDRVGLTVEVPQYTCNCRSFFAGELHGLGLHLAHYTW